MNYFILYLIFHLGCAVLTAGISFAYSQREWPLIAKKQYREDLALSWGISLFGGPVALLVALFMTGFVKHGVKWQ